MIKHLYSFILFNNLFKSSLKPPGGAYLLTTHLRGAEGLIEPGGLLSLAKKKMVSLLHKEPARMQSGTAQAQEVGGHAAKDQKQIRASSW